MVNSPTFSKNSLQEQIQPYLYMMFTNQVPFIICKNMLRKFEKGKSKADTKWTNVSIWQLEMLDILKQQRKEIFLKKKAKNGLNILEIIAENNT